MIPNQTTQIARNPLPTLLTFQPSIFDGIPTVSLLNVATKLSKRLLRGKSVTSGLLATCMTSEYGQTDAEGGWDWKKRPPAKIGTDYVQ
jgi:hypothetical protein